MFDHHKVFDLEDHTFDGVCILVLHRVIEPPKTQALHDSSLISRKTNGALLQCDRYSRHNFNLNSDCMSPRRVGAGIDPSISLSDGDYCTTTEPALGIALPAVLDERLSARPGFWPVPPCSPREPCVYESLPAEYAGS